jgi:hypothetical protein
MKAIFKTRIALLLAGVALTCICSAQQNIQGPGTSATDALNSPLSVPLSEAANFSPMSSAWNFSTGYQWRQIGDLDFKTGSQAARGSLPWMAGRGRSGSVSSTSSSSSSTGTPVTVSNSSSTSSQTSSSSTGSNANVGTAGPVGGIANRTYSDGYVNIETDTPNTGRTGFWGYNSTGQISANGSRLNFQTTAPGASTTTSITTTSTNNASTTGGTTDTRTRSTSTTTFTTQYRSSSSLSDDLAWDSSLSGSGWFARIESPALFIRGAMAVSMEVGYSFANADASHRNNPVFRARQETRQSARTLISAASTSTQTSSIGGSTTTSSSTTNSTNSSTNTITDSYDLAFDDGEFVGNIVLPPAPYAGTADDPQGTQIPNIPASRTITSASSTSTSTTQGPTTTTGTPPDTISSTTATSSVADGGTITETTMADFFSNVTESLDVDLHTISLGPHFSMEWQRVRVGLSTGLAINVADWNADYREDLYVSENGGTAQLLGRYQDHKGGAKVLPGFYIETNANVRLTRRVSLFAGGRYDWAGTLRGTVGPSNFALALGGWSALGGVTITF